MLQVFEFIRGVHSQLLFHHDLSCFVENVIVVNIFTKKLDCFLVFQLVTIKASSFILTKEEAAPEKKTTKKGFHDAEMLEQPPEPVRD